MRPVIAENVKNDQDVLYLYYKIYTCIYTDIYTFTRLAPPIARYN